MVQKREGKEKSQNLKLISSAPEFRAKSSERRRLPRFCLSTEQLRLKETGKVYSVADLSVEGMAIRILDPQDLIFFSVGRTFEATLNLRREKYEVTAQIRHLKDQVVGCQFQEETPQLSRDAISQFLNPETLGRELRLISPQGRESDFSEGDGVSSWYHAPSGTDLLFWETPDGNLQRFVAYIFGSFVQWESEAGLSTGRSTFAEDSEISGLYRYERATMTHDAYCDPGKLEIAKKLFLSSNLPKNLKDRCLDQMTRGLESS